VSVNFIDTNHTKHRLQTVLLKYKTIHLLGVVIHPNFELINLTINTERTKVRLK